ncbi:hypothetical protein QE405_000680 [Nocardioides zeae]|uniref:Efflux RND transporter periplasmic adaptor subunit n=1 Tax=Nocardioides zeae TaxID=1457234 RepID=A0AAJ1TW69_9ACTN|nr:hypothetical protein [Nocardioides zeae]
MTRARGVILAVVVVVAGASACSPGSGDDNVGGAPAPVDDGATYPVAQVRRTTLDVRYTLDAVTAGGSRVSLLPSPQFALEGPVVSEGQGVSAGQAVGAMVVRPAVRAALEGAGTTGASASTLASLQAQEGPVVAPVAGSFASGDSEAWIDAPGMDVTAPLTPIQYLRFLSMRFEATAAVETLTGPRTVGCRALWSVPVEEATPEVAATLHCRVGPDVQTAPAMRSTVTITADSPPDVLVAPNLSIGYDAGTDGYFVVVEDGGSTRKVAVEVGVTDGVSRVVSGDLRAGQVLVPPDDAPSSAP